MDLTISPKRAKLSQSFKELRQREPIKLAQLLAILANDNFYLPEETSIEVHMVWSSGIRKVDKWEGGSFLTCDFIFADDTGHISALINFSENSWDRVDKENICRLLQINKIFKITGFSFFTNTDRYNPSSPGYKHSSSLLTGNDKRIVLGKSSKNILPLANFDPSTSNFYTWIPFDFIELMELDQFEIGTLIDVIGYVSQITNYVKVEKNLKYKRLLLRSSNLDDEGFTKRLTLFGDQRRLIKETGVYAFFKVKVSEFRENVTLQATDSSIILKVTGDNFSSILPPKYRTAAIVTDLFQSDKMIMQRGQSPIANEEIPGPSPKIPRLSLDSGAVTTLTIESLTTTLQEENSQQSDDDEFSNLEVCSSTTDILTEDEQDEEAEKIYNLLETKKPLKVVLTKATKFRDVGKCCYPMRSNPRGAALIINNTHFPLKRKNKDRKGSVHDAIYLRNALKQCGGFHVEIKPNVKSTELRNVIDEFKQDVEEKFSNVDCLFVAVLSHGSFGHVEMVDGVDVNLYDDIIYQFDENQFPIMKEKPKVFVLQTCQDFQTPTAKPETTTNKKLSKSRPHQRNAGGLKNMLICFPASPGSNALRDSYLGSHFIYVLVRVMMERAHNTNFELMMKTVQRKLLEIVHEEKEILTCYWISYMFNKKLYLNPGVGEENEEALIDNHEEIQVD